MLAKSNIILKLPVQGLDFKVDHRVCQLMEPVHGWKQFGTLPYPIVTNANWAEILEKHLAMSQYPGFQVCTPKWLVLKMFLKLYIYNILYIYRRTSSMFSPSWNSEKLAPRPPPPPPPAVRWRRPTAGWVRSEASWCKRPRRPAHGAPAPRRADAVGHDSRHSTWVAGVYPIYPRKNVSFNGILRGYVIIDDISGSEDRIDHQNCSF